jgi:hypothetical protein
MPASSPDLNGKLAGAGLLMAASMHAGVVMLAGDSVREACGKACDHGEEDDGDQRGEEAPPGPSAPGGRAGPRLS